MKLIFELVAQDVNVGVELAKQRDALKALNKELKNVADGSEEQKRLTEQAVKAKLAIADLTEQQKKFNNELKALKVPADSLAGLRLQYSKLAVEISKLSAAERNSEFGQNLIKNAAKVKKEIDGIEQSIGRFTGNVGNYQSAFDGIAAAAGKLGAVFAVLQGGNALVDATRETEKLFAVLNNALGNENTTFRVFEQIKQFALDTPFQVNEIVESFIKLEQRNFKPTIDQLRVIGDITSSQGKSIDQFVEAILDAQTGEFERLKEFGIVAKKNGDQLQVSFKGQTQTIKNTSEGITKYLLELGKLPGIAGAASAVSKTLDGSISNLSDNLTQLFASFGSTGGFLKSFVDGINSVISSVNSFISTPLSDTLREQQSEFNTLIGIVQNVNIEESTRAAAIGELQSKYSDYIGNINLETASQQELSKVLEQGNKLFLQRIFLQENEEKYSEFAKRRIELERRLFEQRKQAAQAETNAAQGSTGSLASALVQTTPLFTVKEIEALNKEVADFQAQQNELAGALFGSVDAAKKAGDEYKKLGNETKKAGEGTVKSKEEAKAAAGSLEFLQERVKKLQEQLEKAPPNQVPKILGDLQKAEKELEAVKNKIEFLKQGGAVAPLDELTVTGEIAPPDLTDLQNTATIDREKELQKTLTAIKINANEAAAKSRADSEKEITKQVEEEEKKRQDIRKAFIQAAFDAAIALTQSIADEEVRKIDETQDEKISALDKEYEEKREAAQGNAQALEAIDKEYQDKKDAIEKEAARERKRIALIESIIAGALATVKALPNIPLVIATGIGAAIQSAIIARQKFAVGGFTGKGSSVDETGERVVNAQLHEGEYVAPRAQVQQFPYLFAQLDRMRNKRGASTGIGYAVGGFTEAPAISLSTAQNRAQSSFNIEAEATIKKEDVYFIAQQVAKETYSAIAQGLNDADRTNERKQRLTELTNV